VNCVSPGPVATELWLGRDGMAAALAGAQGTTPEDVRAAFAAGSLPTGRFTEPDEVATLVALLASPRTANVTGSNFGDRRGLVKTV
jgi:NAD(P)-dependent dehydrogenase (short-subunit alcohol dehydrogenase family)